MAPTAHRDLVATLEALRRRVRTRLLARGLFATFAWLTAAASVVLVLHALLGPHRWLVLATCAGLLVFAAVQIVTWVVLPLARFPSLRPFAARVDDFAGGARNSVMNAFDLGAQREDDPLSQALIDRVVAEGLSPAAGVSAARLDHGPRLRPSFALLGGAALVAILASVVAPARTLTAWLALSNPFAFPYSPPFEVAVTPGNGTVDVGEGFLVSASVTGSDRPATLVYRKEGGAWKGADMMATSRGSVLWQGRFGDNEVSPARPIPKLAYELSLDDLRQDTEYRVRVGRWESPVYAVHVSAAPRVARYEITVEQPSYTGLPAERNESLTGAVAALEGSRVTLAIQTDGDAQGAEIAWTDGATEAAGAAGEGLYRTTWTMKNAGEYRIRLHDRSGRVRFESAPFPVTVLEDQHPLVRVIEPGEDVALPESGELPVALTCADDYGLTRVLLHVEKEGHDPSTTVLKKLGARTREANVEFLWDVRTLDLGPGQRATYFVEVFDNDTIRGPKSTRSPEYEIRFPSDEEMLAEAEREYQGNVVGALDEIHEAQETLRDQVDKVRKAIERSRTGVSWEQRKEVEGMLETQDALQEDLQRALQSLEQSVDRMSESNAADYQVLERMQAIQELLEEIDNERLDELMQEIREALAAMDPQEIEKAMEAMELSQEELLQQLERSLEHLEQVLAEQKLEALLDQVQAMIEEEAAISDSLEAPGEKADASAASDSTGAGEKGDATPPEGDRAQEADSNGARGEKAKEPNAADQAKAGEESKAGDEAKAGEQGERGENEQAPSESSESPQSLAERQEALEQQAQELAKALEEISKLAQENHPRMDQALDKAAPQPPMKNAQENMQSASQELRREERRKALRYTLKAQADLQALMNGLQGAMQSMRANQMQELQEKLVAVGADLLHLSGKQEGVTTEGQGTPTRDLAEGEQRLYEATGRASEKINEIGKETLFVSQAMILNMGKILDDMGQATGRFEEGRRADGQEEATAALHGLNQAVMDIIRTNQQMQSSASSCSNPKPNAMSRIPNLSNMQQELNQATQSLQQQLARQRLSPQSGQQALQQLAARQEAIRRGLEEIQGQLEGRRDILGRLDQLGQDLDEAVKELESGHVDRKLVERQQKILNRLLTAERSLRKQDQDDRREARTGKDTNPRTAPAALTERDLGKKDPMDQEIMQGRSDPFPPRYRSLIDAYFRALSRQGGADPSRPDAEGDETPPARDEVPR